MVYDFGGGFAGNNRLTYVLDDKHNPFRDMNPVVRQLLGVEGILPHSANNPVSSAYYTPASSTVPSETFTYEIIYNANDFPTSIIGTNSQGELVFQTFIEYQ
jgi:hypothetical protein